MHLHTSHVASEERAKRGRLGPGGLRAGSGMKVGHSAVMCQEMHHVLWSQGW